MSSVSHILRQTREAKGITLEEVAQRTYIKLPYLVALEEGDIEKLPAPVYIHGYIRQYAKLLGLNGSELVLQYQQDAGRGNHQPAKVALSPTSRIASLISERTAELEAQRPAAPSFPPPDMRETSLKRMPEPATLVEAPRQPEPMMMEAPRQPEPIVMEAPRRPEPLIMEAPRQPEYVEPTLMERMVPQTEPAVRETVTAPEPTVRELAETSVREPKADISLRELAPEPTAPVAPMAPWEVQQAKQQAQQILNSAQREAQEMRVAAERYADQVLAQLESEVHRTLQTVRNGRAYLQSRRRKLQES